MNNAIQVGFINYPFLAYHDPFLANLRHLPEFQVAIAAVKDEYEDFNAKIEEQSIF